MDVQEEPAFLMPNENRAQNMIENKIKQAQGKYHMYYVKQKVFYLKKENFLRVSEELEYKSAHT